MQPVYRKVRFWFVGISTSAALVFVLGQDYSIRVNRTFVLYQNHLPGEGVVLAEEPLEGILEVLRSRDTHRVTNIAGYRVVRDHVAARCNDGFLLALPDGGIRRFADSEAWVAAVRQIEPAFDGNLLTPSVLRSGVRLGLAILCAAIWITWACVLIRSGMFKRSNGDGR